MIVPYAGDDRKTRLIATGFALIVSLTYFIIAFGLVPEGFKSPPAPVMFVAALAYLVGGTLILRAEQRLLRIGAVVNVLVLIAFVMAVVSGTGTLDVLSLTGKIAQVGLEVLLLMILGQLADAG